MTKESSRLESLPALTLRRDAQTPAGEDWGREPHGLSLKPYKSQRTMEKIKPKMME